MTRTKKPKLRWERETDDRFPKGWYLYGLYGSDIDCALEFNINDARHIAGQRIPPLPKTAKRKKNYVERNRGDLK